MPALITSSSSRESHKPHGSLVRETTHNPLWSCPVGQSRHSRLLFKCCSFFSHFKSKVGFFCWWSIEFPLVVFFRNFDFIASLCITSIQTRMLPSLRSREHCFHQQSGEQVVGLARQDAGLEITNDPKTGSGHRCSRSNLPYNHRASRSINLLHRLPVHHHRGATVVWETKPTTASVELDPSDGKNTARGRTKR